MPSRVLREGLLDSPRYWGAKMEARDFFIRLLLVADDFGLVNLAPVFIARRCFNVRPGEARLEKLYAELCRVDLIRIYLSGSAELPDRFAFIPRFRQTLRQMKARHPMPPSVLYEDDPDAQAKFMQYKQLFAKMPSSRTTDALQTRRRCGADLDLGVDLGVDLETNPKGKEGGLEVPPPPAPGASDAAPPAKPSLNVLNVNPDTSTSTPTPSASNGKDLDQRAADCGITRTVGESNFHLAARIAMACGKAAT